MSGRADPGFRPLLVRPEFYLLALVFLAILMGHRAQLERDPGLAMNELRGYRAAANALVERGCLQLAALPRAGGRRKIEYHAAPGCPSEALFDQYRKTSPLGGDMASLVDQRWVIGQGVIDERLRAIRANSHELRFAGTSDLEWIGSVKYAAGTEPGGVPGKKWVNGDVVVSRQPPCAEMLVDGRKSDSPAKPHQYLQCDGEAWQVVEPIQALSETTNSARRVRDPALASVLMRLETPGMSGDDITTTIDGLLQEATQRLLEAHLDRAPMGGKEEQTIRAGILLMDGKTGEIAAAATYPLEKADVHNSENEPWMLRNWNFERMPVGSTAKIPFAAAIVQSDPSLAGIAPAATSARYCPPGSDGDTCRRKAALVKDMTFEEFIAKSNNGYALWLFDRARNSGQTAWMENLRKFACIEPLAADSHPTCSGYLWRSDEAGKNLQTRGIGEPLLRLEMDQLYGENLWSAVYLDILGGNRSSWTSANLAQAYARIFSNSVVNPRLTPKDTGEIPPLGIDAAVWRRIRDGMAGVLTVEGGTAARLCGAIHCIDGNRRGNLWLYAKTGTSTIADVAADENGQGDNGKVLVLLAAKTATNAEPQKPSDITELKVVVITQRYQAPRREAIDLAIDLFDDPRFQRWIGLGAPAASRGAPR